MLGNSDGESEGIVTFRGSAGEAVHSNLVFNRGGSWALPVT